MSAPYIILSSWPSFCQKLSNMVKVLQSYNKNNFDCFLLIHGVLYTQCIHCVWEKTNPLDIVQ